MEIAVEPISKEEYTNSYLRNLSTKKYLSQDVFYNYEPLIAQLPKLATGPYFWRIYHAANYSLKVAGNVESLTPYSADELMRSHMPADKMIAIFHPDERNFILACVTKFSEYVVDKPIAQRNMQSINIYTRIKNAAGEYKWVNMQYPSFTFDDEGKILSGIIVYYDLSEMGFKIDKPFMTIIDSSINEVFVYKYNGKSDKGPLGIAKRIPGISKRQAEILYFISSGKSSKEIAAILNIAVNTVENHRQRLLKKYGAKTSLELLSSLREHL